MTPAPEPRSAAETRGWLIAKVSERLRLPLADVDPTLPLQRYGLDSLEATNIAYDLERWLGRSLPATLFYDHLSIDAVVQHLLGSGVGD